MVQNVRIGRHASSVNQGDARMELHQEVRALVSRGRAVSVAVADAIAWRAHGYPRFSEWVDDAGASAEHYVRFILHNPSSQTVTIDSAAIMMGDEALFPLSNYSETQHDTRRFPLELAAGGSEPFDFRPRELANLVARHGGRGQVILHGVCQDVFERHFTGRPVLFDIKLANSPPYKGSLAGLDPRARAWTSLADRYPLLHNMGRVGKAHDVLYLTHQDLLAIQQKADTREQPGSTYRGQRIIDFSMWKTGNVDRGGRWRAVMVLADKTRLELVEDRS
jgi:hypothetical protein